MCPKPPRYSTTFSFSENPHDLGLPSIHDEGRYWDPVFAAADPHAPQLNVSFIASPAPIVQNGTTRLFYEMLITNFSKNAFVLDAIEAKAGDTQSKVSGTTLSPLMIHLGAPTGPAKRMNREDRSQGAGQPSGVR